MAKEKKEKHFIQKPEFEGGPTALKQFITKQLQYPKAALEHKIEGTVYLTYSIDYLGKVVEVKVISSLGYGCDEEAIRLVKLLTFKVPKTRKLKIKFNKNIQIHFRLPKQKRTTKEVGTIQYNYQPNTKSSEKDQSKTTPPKKKSYTITIKW